MAGSLIDLREIPGLAELIEAAVMDAVPKAIAAANADKVAVEQAQAQLFGVPVVIAEKPTDMAAVR